MEPRIRFVKTADGLSIACWEHGEGETLLHLPWLPWGHAQLEWRDSELSVWYERLGSFSRLVRYDGRGSGLSDREADHYGVEAQVADMEAVVERLELDRFAVFASLSMGPAAITFAARHPERISCLMLWCTYANFADYTAAPQVTALRSLLYKDWNLYTEAGARAFVGWERGEAAHKLAELMRQSTTQPIVQQFFADMADADVTELLPELTMPTAVLHPRQFPLIDMAAVLKLTGALPEGRLLLFEGSSLAPTRGDLDGVLGAIQSLLLETAAPLAQALRRASGSVAAPVDDGLSAREREVLGLVAGGRSNREIADVLVISPRTVERHIENIYAKIGINNRVQAAAYAADSGFA